MQASTRLIVGTFCGMQIEPGTFHVAEEQATDTGVAAVANASPDRSACLVKPSEEEPALSGPRTLPPNSSGTPKRDRRYVPLGAHFGIFTDQEI